jgi:hypothetical protein
MCDKHVLFYYYKKIIHLKNQTVFQRKTQKTKKMKEIIIREASYLSEISVKKEEREIVRKIVEIC